MPFCFGDLCGGWVVLPIIIIALIIFLRVCVVFACINWSCPNNFEKWAPRWMKLIVEWIGETD